MNKEKFCLSSDVIEISEEDKSYLQMVNRVCYYGAPNANGVILPAETAENFASTLVEMPVYAKCRVNENGEPTFGSHEVCLDENGELFFDTIPIGVHTSVEVKEDTVTVGGVQQTLPCLFATQKIWTRNTNAVAAIKRLFAEGKLHNSWELYNNAYSFSNGLKTITDYEFVGNTLLGYEYADPAYGESAKVLSISESELMVAEALSRDLVSQKEEDENVNHNTNTDPVAESVQEGAEATNVVNESEAQPAADGTFEATPAEGVVANNGESTSDGEASGTAAEAEPEPEGEGKAVMPQENSALTDFDIRDKIRNASQALIDGWCWVAFVFPEQHYALLQTDETDSELSFVKVSYMVNDDDTVTVSDPVKVKLAVPIAEVNDRIAELTETIAALNNDLSNAKAQIEQLEPYREAAENAAKEQKRAELRAYAENSCQFTEEELNSEEISGLIEQMDEAALKSMIADRVVSAQREVIASATASTTSHVTNASIAEGAAPQLDPAKIMKDFFASKIG